MNYLTTRWVWTWKFWHWRLFFNKVCWKDQQPVMVAFCLGPLEYQIFSLRGDNDGDPEVTQPE